MAELEKGKTVSLQELMVSTLAMTDALAKLLIEKGVITEAEFKQKLLEERAVCQRILNPTDTVTRRGMMQSDPQPHDASVVGKCMATLSIHYTSVAGGHDK
jgi:hypothetical protein